MIYKIEIENFCSVRERQILELDVPAGLSDPDGRFAEIFPGSDRKVPKVLAVFGANASGKTTFIKALDVLTRFPRYYPLNTAGGFTFDAFSDLECQEKPISLAIELGGVVQLELPSDGIETINPEPCVYRYELEFERFATGNYVVGKENLYQRPAGAARWRRLFERDRGEVKGPVEPRLFSLSGYARIIDKLPPNASLIATLAEFQHLPSQAIIAASNRVIAHIAGGNGVEQDTALAGYLAQAPDILEGLNKDIRKVDVGLDNLRVEQTPQGPVLLFKHDGLVSDMFWPLESHGTRAFVRLYPLLANVLRDGGVAIVDEMDAQLHPILLSHIVEWFYHRSGRNPHDAQLWFTTHSATILSDLSREEILICEKDRMGRTEAYSLNDVGGVGRRENFYAKYLGGVYGGVPQLG